MPPPALHSVEQPLQRSPIHILDRLQSQGAEKPIEGWRSLVRGGVHSAQSGYAQAGKQLGHGLVGLDHEISMMVCEKLVSAGSTPVTRPLRRA